ncbi:MAG: tetratricopeptide repeat protein [Verrucomicrobia bacterium]|nr:tetratricopeptide repeat protein [Verrucomicrobiota bacterium]
MTPEPHLQRALLLQQQDRHAQAETELRKHLAGDPRDAVAHASMALSLAALDRLDEAEAAAREAAGIAPDLAFAWYALAQVLSDRNRPDDAAGAIAEAIRHDPGDADYQGVRAGIEFQRRRWADALAAAEAGLASDPEHVGCNNLRAMALVKLGRKSEAGTTLDATLSRAPDNSLSHANKGWTLLEQGDHRQAMTHFRESLRLDPSNDWARQGLVEALKSGNPVYAVMLRYFLWMDKLSEQARWGILVGGYVGSRMLGSVASSHPEWAPWILPVRIAYIAFALLTWLAQPLFNLLLFLHPVGRHALDATQRRQAGAVGVCAGVALASLVTWMVSGFTGPFLTPALVFGLLAVPVAAVFACQPGWPRLTMSAIALVLAAAGLTAVAIAVLVRPDPKTEMATLGSLALSLFLLGTFLSQWIANLLMSRTPQR